jgi:hypothetical protein
MNHEKNDKFPGQQRIDQKNRNAGFDRSKVQEQHDKQIA